MEASTHLPPPADAEVTSTSSTGSSLSYSAFSTALILAQTLHAQASALPSASHRARYLKELETVSGLIAYQNPEESPVRHFLDVQRRKVLADGVDRAILCACHTLRLRTRSDLDGMKQYCYRKSRRRHWRRPSNRLKWSGKVASKSVYPILPNVARRRLYLLCVLSSFS